MNSVNFDREGCFREENIPSEKRSWKLVNFCEFDKYAIKSYCAIHNVDENLNLGDITKVDETKLKPFNMICGGSPCQDFSVAGKQAGSRWVCQDCKDENGEPYSYNPLTVHYSVRDKCPHCGSKNIDKTRSSLLVEWLRVIRANKPIWGIYENVKNIVGKKFKKTFDMFIQELHEYGYNTYYKVLNAKYYGIPQNRERVYLIIILKEYDNGKFVFPEGFDNGKCLKDMLEREVDEKFYVDTTKSNELIDKLLKEGKLDKTVSNTIRSGGRGSMDKHQLDLVKIEQHTGLFSKQCTKYKEADVATTLLARDYKGFGNQQMNGVIDVKANDNEIKKLIHMGVGGQKGWVYSVNGITGTLPASQYKDPTKVVVKKEECGTGIEERNNSSWYRIRRLIPKECFRLMGFKDEDFDKAQNAGVSNSQLYKQAGNSIVVDVLYYIFVELYKAMPYLFYNLKLSSFFSGIGAFESALDRLYESINTGNFINPQVE